MKTVTTTDETEQIDRDHTNEKLTTMKRMILDRISELDSTTTDETTHETSPGAPQAPGRARTGTMRRFIVILFLLALGVSTGRAQSSVSITTSPLQIAEKIYQFNGELKLLDVVSAVGIAGIGTRDGERVTLGGGQIRFYLMGGFDGGLHIGAEALYAELGTAGSIDGIVNLMNGAAAGPFVGYKHVLPFGLTLDVQGGLRYSEGRIETESETTSDSKLGPLANINVGWSF